MSDLKIVSTEEEVQMAAQTENTVGIVELSDSDLESILGVLRSSCSGGSCCDSWSRIGDIVSIRSE